MSGSGAENTTGELLQEDPHVTLEGAVLEFKRRRARVFGQNPDKIDPTFTDFDTEIMYRIAGMLTADDVAGKAVFVQQTDAGIESPNSERPMFQKPLSEWNHLWTQTVLRLASEQQTKK